jgi:hypothetical protein
MSGRRLLRGALAALLIAIGAPAPAQTASNAFAPIAIKARPIQAFEFGKMTTRFGELEFRGGLELSSRNRDFGAWSGLDFDEASGLLLAVADTGLWLTARPVETNGWLTGIAEARIARMLDTKGRQIRRKSLGDAEAVRLVNRGSPGALVFYEASNSLRFFRGPLDKLAATAPTEMPLPEGARRRETEQGIEALAVAPLDSALRGAVVLLAEHDLDAAGNNRAWILDGPLAGAFAVRPSDNYDVTDADFLPNGDLMILERRFGVTEGVGMRLRRFAASTIVPGAVLEGTVVMEADLRHQIDNMEGLALRAGAGGEMIIDIISDDNKSILQRTLLLQFAWKQPTKTAAAGFEAGR